MIDIRQLSYHYKGHAEVYSDLNLNMSPNHIYGLLGKNGAGKSTLLKIIMGMVFPQRGHCLVNEQVPSQRESRFLNKIYFVPQELYIPPVSLKQYLNLYAPFYPDFNREQFYTSLNEFELPRQTQLQHLSHGQKKKFFIAFALATGVPLILLDEPTNGLDIPSKAQFRQLIAEHADMGKTFFISTHEIHDVQHLVDALVILNDGKIVLNAEVAQINRVLQMGTQSNPPDPHHVIYQEKALGGYRVIQARSGDKETDMDFECLFNAAVSAGDAIHALFLGDKNEQ